MSVNLPCNEGHVRSNAFLSGKKLLFFDNFLVDGNKSKIKSASNLGFFAIYFSYLKFSICFRHNFIFQFFLFFLVFNSLLKAHAIEVRGVVRQALEILTPAMPVRMVGGYTMLAHWTKKIIVEEGHLMPQLFHILQLIVRHYKVLNHSSYIFKINLIYVELGLK